MASKVKQAYLDYLDDIKFKYPSRYKMAKARLKEFLNGPLGV